MLGAHAVRAAVERAGVAPDSVYEVIAGHVVAAGAGQAPARQAAIRGGLPHSVGASAVSKVCGSGLKAVMLAANGIMAGEADVYVAGGMESMSNAPYLCPKCAVVCATAIAKSKMRCFTMDFGAHFGIGAWVMPPSSLRSSLSCRAVSWMNLRLPVMKKKRRRQRQKVDFRPRSFP